jgi:hypothetical protein
VNSIKCPECGAGDFGLYTTLMTLKSGVVLRIDGSYDISKGQEEILPPELEIMTHLECLTCYTGVHVEGGQIVVDY